MREQADQNKTAWNYRAYEWWEKYNGSPKEFAEKIQNNPSNYINYRYKDLLVNFSGKRILNVLGSNGRKAVPLAALGARVTVIDISEENRRYAMALARHTGVELEYIVADFAEYENAELMGKFDIVFAEGGILHYFTDIENVAERFVYYLAEKGCLILNDFHPFGKILHRVKQTDGDYFDERIHEGPVAYEDQFHESEHGRFPKCLLRFYTLGEIVTAVARSGLRIRELRELRRGGTEKTPGEFTLVATKT